MKLQTTLSDDMVSLLEGGKALAYDTFEEQGHVGALAMVESAEEVFLLKLGKADTPEAKLRYRKAIQNVLDGCNAIGICFISEVWYSSDTSTQPALATDKREALLVFAENRDGEQGAFIADIDRDGLNINVGEWREFPSPVGGVFSGFFAAARPALLN